MSELVDSRRDLKPLHQDLTLPLKANVLGPTDKAGKISRRLDVSTNTKVSGGLGEDGSLLVGNSLLLFTNALTGWLGGGGNGSSGTAGSGFATRLADLVRC